MDKVSIAYQNSFVAATTDHSDPVHVDWPDINGSHTNRSFTGERESIQQHGINYHTDLQMGDT